MFSGKTIAIIIPALNEAGSIAKVIRDIPGYVDDIVVVDNGSTDQTDVIAREAGARVVYQSVRGYGAACLAGIRSLRNMDIVGFIDGDYSDYPDDLRKLLEPVACGQYDFAMGQRQCVENNADAISFHQKLGNWLACHLIHGLHGFSFMDLGPMRCLTHELLSALQMEDEDFGWTTEMQIKVLRAQARILLTPVRYRKRIGQSKISGTFRGSFLAGYKIIYWTVRLSLSSSGRRIEQRV
jgi:glycosyltransferase involved in cell wall biosynthesis